LISKTLDLVIGCNVDQVPAQGPTGMDDKHKPSKKPPHYLRAKNLPLGKPSKAGPMLKNTLSYMLQSYLVIKRRK